MSQKIVNYDTHLDCSVNVPHGTWNHTLSHILRRRLCGFKISYLSLPQRKCKNTVMVLTENNARCQMKFQCNLWVFLV